MTPKEKDQRLMDLLTEINNKLIILLERTEPKNEKKKSK